MGCVSLGQRRMLARQSYGQERSQAARITDLCFDAGVDFGINCIPSAELGHSEALSEETFHGVRDPEESLDVANQKKQSTEAAIRDIRRRTRRKFSPEEKIRIVLEGLRGEQSVSELCRREGIAANLYYRWSKDFLEAGKKQLAGDTVREATSDEVKALRSENRELKEVVAEITLKNRVLKKSLTGLGEEDDT